MDFDPILFFNHRQLQPNSKYQQRIEKDAEKRHNQTGLKQITVNRADLLYLRNNKVSKNKLPEILVQRAAKQD